jgi:hypothetical protein
MRRVAGGIAIAVAAAGCGSGQAAPRALPPVAFTVPCGDDIASVRSATADGYRVVLGAVAVPPAFLDKPVRLRDSRWPYWRKAGLLVRAGRTPVTVLVPRAWRRRAAITWGNGRPAVSALRIAACRPAPNDWNAYAGGFFTRSRRACVPLTFVVGGRSQTVSFGVGGRCRKRT